MKMYRIFLVSLLLLLQTACATNGSSISPDGAWNDLEESSLVFDDFDIEEIMAKRPQLQTPFRLAIAPPLGKLQRSDRYRPSVESGWWTAEEVEQIKAWGKRAEQAGLISELVFLNATLLDGDWESSGDKQGQLKRIRMAGARLQADAVLVFNSITKADSTASLLSILDLTIVLAFIVPSHRIDSFTAMETLLIDVRNEYLYLSARADHAVQDYAPGFDSSDTMNKVVADSRSGALAKIQTTLMDQVTRLAVTNNQGTK